MGWAVGYDDNWQRDIGYGVPCKCDHPDCNSTIHRGLAYVCGGEPHGGEEGCGLYFCSKHLWVGAKLRQVCERCAEGKEPFTPKPDVRRWIKHKLTDKTWQPWRDENPKEVAALKAAIQK